MALSVSTADAFAGFDGLDPASASSSVKLKPSADAGAADASGSSEDKTRQTTRDCMAVSLGSSCKLCRTLREPPSRPSRHTRNRVSAPRSLSSPLRAALIRPTASPPTAAARVEAAACRRRQADAPPREEHCGTGTLQCATQSHSSPCPLGRTTTRITFPSAPASQRSKRNHRAPWRTTQLGSSHNAGNASGERVDGYACARPPNLTVREPRPRARRRPAQPYRADQHSPPSRTAAAAATDRR